MADVTGSPDSPDDRQAYVSWSARKGSPMSRRTGGLWGKADGAAWLESGAWGAGMDEIQSLGHALGLEAGGTGTVGFGRGQIGAGGQSWGQSSCPNCLQNCRLAWIRLYCSKSFKVWDRHAGVSQFTSHMSLREWDRFRISMEEIAMAAPVPMSFLLFYAVWPVRVTVKDKGMLQVHGSMGI